MTDKNPSNLIVKSNALVEAAFRLGALESRVLLTCLSQVRNGKIVTDKVMYTVKVADLEALTGSAPHQAYENLKNAANRLMDRKVSIYLDSGRKILNTRWVQTVEYCEEFGEIALRLGKDVLPYLANLKREFTKYGLENVVKLTSSHAIRIYEFLQQWRERGERTILFQWLRVRLGLEKSYKTAGDLKKFVIEPAIKQINLHTDISITHHSYQKTGRQISSVTIKFHVKRKRRSSAPPNLELFPDKWAPYRETIQNKDKQNINEKLNTKS